MKKRLFALVMLALMTISSAGSVFAANTEDRAFSFSAGVNYTNTDARNKYNTTPVYVKVDANKPAAYIKVYGFILLDAQGNYGWANCTEGVTSVTARPGVASSIHTQVYENRGTQTYVRTMLKGRSAHASIGTLGVWSPDSTRTYTFLN